LLALARESEGVAFVPGRAAYVDGRSGSSSMRLNFAGVPDADIREGMRRIGKVVREQLSLFGTLSGSPLRSGAAATPVQEPSSPPPPANAGHDEHGASAGQDAPAGLADVVALPRRRSEGSARRRRDR
jgi:hypothetical protein